MSFDDRVVQESDELQSEIVKLIFAVVVMRVNTEQRIEDDNSPYDETAMARTYEVRTCPLEIFHHAQETYW